MKVKLRNQRGGHQLAEFAGVLVVGLPLLTLLVFVGLECGHFYTIKSAMEVGARDAARALVVNYNLTGTEKTVVDWLTIPNYINNSNQFTVVWDSKTPPAFVTVSCAYPSGGGNGLPPFPAGPLRYLITDTKFDLGTFSVKGTFTVPVQ